MPEPFRSPRICGPTTQGFDPLNNCANFCREHLQQCAFADAALFDHLVGAGQEREGHGHSACRTISGLPTMGELAKVVTPRSISPASCASMGLPPALGMALPTG